jgi:hypothetical protein
MAKKELFAGKSGWLTLHKDLIVNTPVHYKTLFKKVQALKIRCL